MEKTESEKVNEAVLWSEDWNEEWEGQKRWFHGLSDDQKKDFVKERASDLHTKDKKWQDGIGIIKLAKKKLAAEEKIKEISKIIDPKKEKYKDITLEKLMKALIKEYHPDKNLDMSLYASRVFHVLTQLRDDYNEERCLQKKMEYRWAGEKAWLKTLSQTEKIDLVKFREKFDDIITKVMQAERTKMITKMLRLFIDGSWYASKCYEIIKDKKKLNSDYDLMCLVRFYKVYVSFAGESEFGLNVFGYMSTLEKCLGDIKKCDEAESKELCINNTLKEYALADEFNVDSVGDIENLVNLYKNFSTQNKSLEDNLTYKKLFDLRNAIKEYKHDLEDYSKILYSKRFVSDKEIKNTPEKNTIEKSREELDKNVKQFLTYLQKEFLSNENSQEEKKPTSIMNSILGLMPASNISKSIKESSSENVINRTENKQLIPLSGATSALGLREVLESHKNKKLLSSSQSLEINNKGEKSTQPFIPISSLMPELQDIVGNTFTSRNGYEWKSLSLIQLIKVDKRLLELTYHSQKKFNVSSDFETIQSKEEQGANKEQKVGSGNLESIANEQGTDTKISGYTENSSADLKKRSYIVTDVSLIKENENKDKSQDQLPPKKSFFSFSPAVRIAIYAGVGLAAAVGIYYGYKQFSKSKASLGAKSG